MTTTEAGQKLGGYCRQTVIKLIEEGKLAATRLKPGGQYRIDEQDLLECKEKLKIKATAFGKK